MIESQDVWDDEGAGLPSSRRGDHKAVAEAVVR